MTSAQHIIYMMERYGFQPSRMSDPFYIEFVKRYADDEGRMAQAAVHFDRPTPSTSDPRLARFHILVQAAIDPTEEAVLAKAPAIAREDLLAITRTLQANAMPDAIVVRTCVSCGRSVSEFFVVAGRLLCRSCRG